MMRNEGLAPLDHLIGEWELTLSGAWYLESLDAEQRGQATFEWLGDAFVSMTGYMEGERIWDFVFGRSDSVDEMYALYHDRRGVNRLFSMTFGDGRWTMSRSDPDFHQRFIGEVEADTITGRWEASEDEGQTWRKDFDLTFSRIRS